MPNKLSSTPISQSKVSNSASQLSATYHIRQIGVKSELLLAKMRQRLSVVRSDEIEVHDRNVAHLNSSIDHNALSCVFLQQLSYTSLHVESVGLFVSLLSHRYLHPIPSSGSRRLSVEDLTLISLKGDFHLTSERTSKEILNSRDSSGSKLSMSSWTLLSSLSLSLMALPANF